MRATVIYEHGDLDCLRYETDFPEPELAEGQVLVEVKATSINYHDIFTRRGMPGIRIRFPIITGSDIAGVVLETGPGVSGWSPGDRVLLNPTFSSKAGFGLIGETRNGGKAERVCAEAGQLIRLPDAVTFEQAASLPLAYATAHRMLFTRGNLQPGEKVLVLGASGGVGVACVQLAHMIGAEVAACASTDEKLQRLGKLGAEHLVNYTDTSLVDGVSEAFGRPRVWGEGGANVVVNFTGGDTWAQSLRCVKKGGRVLTCGATAGFDPQTDLRYIWTFEETILGSNGWALSDLETLLGHVANERLLPEIDRVLPLQETREAERLLEDREVFGKVIITP